MKSKVKIRLKRYSYRCGDGCCYNYGTITTVNDEELPFHNEDIYTVLQGVLEKLGYKVDIEEEDDHD